MNSTSIHDFGCTAPGVVRQPLIPPSNLTPWIKTAIVNSIAKIPSYRAQRTIAAVVRSVWPGFSCE